MNKLIVDSIEITGFRGESTFSVNLDDEVNFFIGINGSGKTTIINIIAAVLQSNIRYIDQSDFERVSLRLKSKVAMIEEVEELFASIIVTKHTDEESKSGITSWEVNHWDPLQSISETFGDYEDEIYRRSRIHEMTRIKGFENSTRGLRKTIGGLVDTSWLTIHRIDSSIRDRKSDRHESTVDQKLLSLIEQVSNYFKNLNNEVAKEVASFQSTFILSMLTTNSDATVSHSTSEEDLKRERDELEKILTTLNIDQFEARAKLSSFFAGYEKSLKKIAFPEKENISLSDFDYLAGAFRIRSVLAEWNDSILKQEKVLKPKVAFLKIVNDLFTRKEINVDENENLVCSTKTGKTLYGKTFSSKALKFNAKTLKLTDLSSGEKQLIIILGEALLQQSKSWIYMADEPELSLHVTWQSCLIDVLKRINPNAQIICATHSPDIVGKYNERAIDVADQFY